MNPNTDLTVPIRHTSRTTLIGGDLAGREYLEEQIHNVADVVGMTAMRQGASLLRGATPLFATPWTTEEQVQQLLSLRGQLKEPVSNYADRIMEPDEALAKPHDLRSYLSAAMLFSLIDFGGKEYGRHYDLDFNVNPAEISKEGLVALVDGKLRRRQLIKHRQTIAQGKIRNLQAIGTWIRPFELETLFGSEFEIAPTETTGLTKLSIRTGKWINESGKLWGDGKFLVDADVNAEFYLAGDLALDLRGRHGLSTDRMRWKLLKYDSDREDLIVRPVVSTFSSDNLEDTTIRFPRTDEITKQLPVYLNLASRALVQSISFGFEIEDPETEMLPEISPELGAQAFAENPKLSSHLINRMRTAFHLDPKKATEICHRLGLFKVSPSLAKLNEDQVQELIAEMPDAQSHFEFRKNIGEAYNPFITMARKLREFGVANFDGSLGWGILSLLFYDQGNFERGIIKTHEPAVVDALLKIVRSGLKNWVQYLSV